MTADEELIKATWARHSGPWPTHRTEEGRHIPAPRLRVVIQRPLPRVGAPVQVTAALSEHYLTFERELGIMNGEPWYRIVCQGVVVEEGPR